MSTVHFLWMVLLVVSVIILPFIVRLLHGILSSARRIERYLRDMRDAGAGIAANTDHIKALNNTIEVASEILHTGGKINGHAETLSGALEKRAEKRKN
jgi:hypothetical protein